MVNLAFAYQRGDGLQRDYKQAAAWYGKASEAGNADGAYCLGVMYESGQGVEKNLDQAIITYRKAAQLGSQNARDALKRIGANFSVETANFETSDPRLNDVYRRATGGDSDSMDELGISYENGWGVNKDYKQAVRWYRQAAQAGNARGMGHLGAMFLKGYGVEKDYQQALNWSRKAADAGDSTGLCSLSTMYLDGYGVEKDYQQGFQLAGKCKEALVQQMR